MRRAIAVVALAAAVPVGTASAATRVDLGGPWRFRIDADGTGERRGWARTPPALTEEVDVPHTWGVGPHAEHEGIAWYFRDVAVPDAPGQRVELHFGATFYKARVFANGALVGEHEGGHTAWFVDVTPHVRGGIRVAVEIDNRPDAATIPGWALKLEGTGNVWYDWWHYGGLVREVWLELRERAAIRRQQIRALPGDAVATVTTTALLEGFLPAEQALRLDGVVRGPGGEEVARASTDAVVGSQGARRSLVFRLPEPALWHFDRPHLYSLELTLLDSSGAVLDERADRFGVRSVEIRDRGIFLNGERVRLSGVTRHQTSPWEGLAETRGTMRRDWDDLKALQVTLTRPVHYPQHPHVLDYADENGVLLVPEIPMWQFSEAQMADARVVDLAKRMMREMIEEAFNHPSVFAWSVCNESATNTAGGRAYVKAMRDLVEGLDPDRYVSYADDGLPWVEDAASNANQHTDFLMMNQYFGSWQGPADELAPALERIGRLFPDKPLVVSEFGLAGPFARDAAHADEKRISILQRQLREFARHDWIAGAVFWCYQNYKSHRNLWPGETTGYVDMGLVDENRQRRPSYDAWAEATRPVRVEVAWTGERWRPPSGFQATIRRRGPEEIPSYELRGYRAEWEVRDHDGTVVARGSESLPTIGAPAGISGGWHRDPSRAYELRLRILRPSGHAAYDGRETWWDPRSGGLGPEESRRRGLAAPPKP